MQFGERRPPVGQVQPVMADAMLAAKAAGGGQVAAQQLSQPGRGRRVQRGRGIHSRSPAG